MGFNALKVDPIACDAQGQKVASLRGFLPIELAKVFRDRIRAIREAVGDGFDILLEMHGALSTPSAIQLGRMLEPYDCYFYEEPVDSMNVTSMAEIRQAVKIPLAAGERLYTRWGFRPYLEQRLLAVIQPDLGLAGGLTEGKKICDLAHLYDAGLQCHVCGTAVATAASLQLEAAVPNFAIHEHHLFALKKANREIIQQALQPENGTFSVPDDPGLGIELNDEVVSRYDRIVVT